MAAQNTDGSIDVDLDDDETTVAVGTEEPNSSSNDVDDIDEDEEHSEDSTDTASQDLAAGGAIDVDIDDTDREAIRERRRQERQERKLRTREREETLRRELSSRDTLINQMRQELDVINKRNSGSEMAQLASAKEEAAKSYRYFKDQIRVGTESNNGTLVADATEKMMLARKRHDDLTSIEKTYNQHKQQPQPLDPRVANNARNWTENHKWYDPQGKDADSRIVLTIDQTLAEEGFNPTTKEYWDELESRVKKYLPHRANRGIITAKPKIVVSGGGREAGSKSSTTFRLSPERVQALKDAGKWEDPVERNKMVKQYREYDKLNGKTEGAR